MWYDSFFSETSIKLSTFANDNFLSGFSILRTCLFHNSYNIHPFDNFAENDVLAIKPWRQYGSDKELRTVGVGTGISHRQQAIFIVLLDEILVSKFRAIDTFASCAIMVGEVTALKHKVGNDPVKSRCSVAKALLSSAQRSEILSCFRNYVVVEFKYDPTSRFSIDGNVKETLRSTHY